MPKTMASVGKSKSDIIYRRLLLSKFFTGGWGEIDTYKRLAEFREKLLMNREKFNGYVPISYPVHLEKSWSRESCYIAEGRFESPLAKHMPGLLPKESEEARFQILIPKQWSRKDRKPMCVHLAGTGDHFFWRRRNFMAKPLASESSVASVILENPYYGVRKPKDQVRSSLKCVSDLFVMGAALILETMVLLRWCERRGYGPLALSGISMGGHMASIAATAWPKPLGIIPCLSWSTASCVFTQGVMSRSCAWNELEKQLVRGRFRENLLSKVKQLNVQGNEHSHKVYKKINETDYLESSVNYSYEHTKPYILKTANHKNHDVSQTIVLDSKSVKQQVYNSFKEAVLEYVPSAFGKNDHQGPLKHQETVDFMNYLMDETTHLRNYPIPIDPSLATFVIASHDAYIPRDKIENVGNIWYGCHVWHINAGHVSGSLKHTDTFRRAIKSTLDKMQCGK